MQESCTPGSTGGVSREGHVYQPKPHVRICRGACPVRGKSTRPNSAGQEVIRDYVKDQDELLEEAEKAAGGSLDDFIELKNNWYQNEEGTIK